MIAYFLIVVGLAAGQPTAQIVGIAPTPEDCAAVLVEVDAELKRSKLAAAGACVAVNVGGEDA